MPEDALGTLVKLPNCANCSKYLTLLHCEISGLTEQTGQTDPIELTVQTEQTEPTELTELGFPKDGFPYHHHPLQVRVASVLLESGAKPNATNKIGQTALIYAVIIYILRLQWISL